MFWRKRHREVMDALWTLINSIAQLEVKFMATLDQIKADVEAEATLIAGVGTLIDGLKAQIAAALPPGTLTADQQAEIDAIFATAEANKAALAAALQANTPAPGA